MNNLDYICKRHPEIVGSILEDLAAQDAETELALTLRDVEFPDGVMDSCTNMMEWLDEEREPGAWAPGDCAADIVRDVQEVGDNIGVANYLDARGIGYEDETVEGLTHLALMDVSMRWTALYASAISGPIFESNFNRRLGEMTSSDRQTGSN